MKSPYDRHPCEDIDRRHMKPCFSVEAYLVDLALKEDLNQELLAEVQDFVNRTVRTPVFA